MSVFGALSKRASQIQKIKWGFSEGGGSCNSRFVLKPDATIASEVSMSSKNSITTTDFLSKKMQLVNHRENPPSWNPPPTNGLQTVFFETVVFRVVCSEGDTDPQGRKARKHLQTQMFSGVLLTLSRGCVRLKRRLGI